MTLPFRHLFGLTVWGWEIVATQATSGKSRNVRSGIVRFGGAVMMVLLLAGCASMNRAYGTDPSLPASIELALAGKPEAVEPKVFAALVRGGWQVSDRTTGLITVGPYKPSYDTGITLVLRATLIPEGTDSTRVIVSGVVAGDALAESFGRGLAGGQGMAAGRGNPIRQATAGRNLRNWQELERFARAAQGAT